MKQQFPKITDNKMHSPTTSPSINTNICLPALGNCVAKEDNNKRTPHNLQKHHFDYKKETYIEANSDPTDLRLKQLPGLHNFKDRNSIIGISKSTISDTSINKISSSPHKDSVALMNGNLKSNKYVIHSILNEMLAPPETHLRKQSKEKLDPIDEKYIPVIKGLQPLNKPVLHKRLNIPFKDNVNIEGKEMQYEVRITDTDCENAPKSELLNVDDKKEAKIHEMFKTHEKWVNDAINQKDNPMVYTLKLEDYSSGSGSSHTLIDRSKIDFSLVASKKSKEEDDSVPEHIIDDDDNDKSSSFCSKIIDSSELDSKKISGDNIFTCLAVFCNLGRARQSN